ncbi:salivary glue protein Sgs-3-like [Solanum tuberosum]|uniref:salivary glue protein Sgs-3-like n=1 Tax=Solanum tuberosum TaxID=4113 RepID=UPI00073A31A8|nr:PREDICTED: salivary glue protein Sgs-3-like [Solanum tuberosum]
MSMGSEKGGEHSSKAATEGTSVTPTTSVRPIIASTSVERPTSATSTGVSCAIASTFGERPTSATTTGVRPTISSTSKERPTSAILSGVRPATNLLGTQQLTSSAVGQKRKSNTTLRGGGREELQLLKESYERRVTDALKPTDAHASPLKAHIRFLFV